MNTRESPQIKTRRHRMLSVDAEESMRLCLAPTLATGLKLGVTLADRCAQLPRLAGNKGAGK